MRTFSEYVAEATYNKKIEAENSKISKFSKNYTHNGYSITSSIHAASQAHLRRPEFDTSDWEKLHQKSVNHIIGNNVQSGKHIFYSKLQSQGYYADVNTQAKHMHIISVLEKGMSRTTDKDTQKHLFESIQSIQYVD